MNDYEYLIWSNEHRGWWRPSKRGYTPNRDESGRYSYREACEIVYGANKYQKVSDVPNETMVRVQSNCCSAPLIDGVQCLNCGQDDDTWFDKVCEICGGLGYLTSPAEQRGGHIIGPDDRPCPACKKREDDYNPDQ